MKLKGKIALVTGSSRGIGHSVALALAKEGASVILHYGKNEAQAAALADQIQKNGGHAALVQADLTSLGGVQKLYSGVDKILSEKWKTQKFDVLVNNAGVADYSNFDSMTEESFDNMFAVNVKAIYFGTREALKRINDGGRIVNISSIVAKHAFPDLTAYNATKGAVEVLTFNFAKMAGERNITVNAVAPGATLTDMAPWLESPDGKNMALSQQSLKRIGQPTDIAEVVLALASGMSWVTGQSIDASGGWAL